MIPYRFQICLFSFLVSLLEAQQPLLDLKKVGELLHYPSENLVLENCLESEKLIYIIQSRNYPNDNELRRIDPESIRRSYKIYSKIKSSFHPIKITIVESNFYRSSKFIELESAAKTIQNTSISGGEAVPIGEFQISSDVKGFLIPDTILIPTRPIHFDNDPSGTERYFGNRPEKIDATSVFVKIPDSGYDLRVSRFARFEGPAREMVKVKGGEEYYNTFFSDPLDSNPGNMAKELFGQEMVLMVKNLSRVVFESQLVSAYIADKDEVAPTTAPPESATIKDLPKNRGYLSIQPGVLENRQKNSILRTSIHLLWIVPIIALVLLILFFLHRINKKT